MNVRLLCLLVSLLPYSLSGQDSYHTSLLSQLQNNHNLSGGSWLRPPNEQTNLTAANIYGCTSQILSVSGQDFGQAHQLTIPGTGTNPWDAGYILSNTSAIQAGDRVLAVVWMRRSPGSSQPAKLSLYLENAATYEKEIYLTTELEDTWQQYLLPFESTASYAVGDLNMGFHLNYFNQQVEIAGFNAINYAQTVPFSQLPSQFYLDYAGSSPTAPWRAQAAARIEQYRKADLNLTITDQQGNVLPNATVRVEMLQHEFGFGTAVNPRRLAGNSGNDPVYAAHLTDLDGEGHGFNVAVTENALKWRAWEQGWAGTQSETVLGLQWLHNQGITTRGHVLVWPGWDFMPSDMQANANDPSFLENQISDHLSTMLNQPTVRALVREWDVINEISHVRDLENALAGQPGYPTGREIYADILEEVQTLDPDLVTYLNDYGILDQGSVSGATYQLFSLMIQQILSAGASVDGIGFQAHMGTSLTAPDSLYAILEDCYQTFGKPIKITEYDLDGFLPDSLEAQYLGDFLTMTFSHQAVEGFLMWGFWDGAHWENNAPLFYQDWTPKPALGTFNELVFDQWWTDITLQTDVNGQLDLRGFKGIYRITAELDGSSGEAQLQLSSDTTAELSLFLVNSVQTDLANKFHLYPNPAQDLIHLELPHSASWTLELIDAQGKKIQQVQQLGQHLSLSIQSLTAGIYLLHARDKEGNSLTQRFMKVGKP